MNTSDHPQVLDLLLTKDQRRTRRHEAEQFELFPASPPRRHPSHIVPGDDDDPTQTLVVDGTRDADLEGLIHELRRVERPKP